MKAFSGDLLVEPNDFTLYSDAFIVREDEVSFVLFGQSDEGLFSIEGLAMLNEHGFYIAPRIPVMYREYPGDFCASVKFGKVQLSPAERICEVEGIWIESGVEWSFSGRLKVNA